MTTFRKFFVRGSNSSRAASSPSTARFFTAAMAGVENRTRSSAFSWRREWNASNWAVTVSGSRTATVSPGPAIVSTSARAYRSDTAEGMNPSLSFLAARSFPNPVSMGAGIPAPAPPRIVAQVLHKRAKDSFFRIAGDRFSNPLLRQSNGQVCRKDLQFSARVLGRGRNLLLGSQHDRVGLRPRHLID